MGKNKGFSLIELLIVVVIIGILAAVAIPNLLASRRAANEGAAISTIRTIHSSQLAFYSSVGVGKYAQDLKDLRDPKIIDSNLGCETEPCVKQGYYFIIDADNPSDGSIATWNAYAYPTVSSGISQTGSRAFYINETGIIYYRSGDAPPTASANQDSRTPTNGSVLNN